MEKTMVRQAVPLQPMEVDGGADIHLQPMEDPMLEQEINSHNGLKSDDFPDNNDKRIEDLMDVPNLVEVNDGAPKRFDLVMIN
ncbi:AN1-type zinc finger protein 5-like [Grus japonensis]|uniref:AN1-type zinc finger protein 5-like n=1 Tax=Grus japonensis TaxID=30415 RepID=A0ABC9WM07_GRUJA